MIAILTEKYDVAEHIAAIVGATAKAGGRFQGGEYVVTWANGHLLSLTCPEDGSPWLTTTLPILPTQFYLAPRKDTHDNRDRQYAEKQLEVIARTLNEAEYVIAGTDAGREGQLIFEYIYAYVGCTRPVKRLWISSMTDQGIRDGMATLRDNSEFRNLYLSASCRAMADWLVGINATRAMTLCGESKRVLSVGRVQTPLLCMICKRYMRHYEFEPEPYWTVKATAYKGSKTFRAVTEKKFHLASEADAQRAALTADKELKVLSYEENESVVEPPRLYNTTKLQEDANTHLNLTAGDTMKILQSLYIKHKVITYPRTESRNVTKDVFDTIPGLMENMASWRRYDAQMARLDPDNLNDRCVNPLKITDHHAIIITGTRPPIGAMTQMEAAVFDMIATRMLEALSGASIQVSVTARLESKDGHVYVASGTTIKEPGWKAIRMDEQEMRETEEGGFENQNLPKMERGEVIRVLRVQSIEGQTKAPALYRDGSLMNAMKYAGRDIENETLRKKLKNSGLGTADTRYSELETLLDRGFVSRDEEGHILPTKTGLAMYFTVKDKDFADIAMTAQWETDLEAIENGDKDPVEFDTQIRKFVSEQVVAEIMNPDTKATLMGALAESQVRCPYCQELMESARDSVRCTCGFSIPRIKSGRAIDEFEMEELIEKGETPVLKGFVNDKGKRFSAALIRTPQKKVQFKYNNNNFNKRDK